MYILMFVFKTCNLDLLYIFYQILDSSGDNLSNLTVFYTIFLSLVCQELCIHLGYTLLAS